MSVLKRFSNSMQFLHLIYLTHTKNILIVWSLIVRLLNLKIKVYLRAEFDRYMSYRILESFIIGKQVLYEI